MTDETIGLDHGSGGKMSHALISELILPFFDSPALHRQDDGAVLELNGGRLAFSTDSYVVDPVFFPGGNIGDLAVNGTVNDIAMCGGMPRFISAGLIIEEGFSVHDLKQILETMARAAGKAGVAIVTGDTKVVPKGKADKIFINTAGIGVVKPGVNVSGANARPGDVVIVSGTLADHGMAVLSAREDLRFDADIRTDSAPLNGMVQAILDSGRTVRVLRDPTRGGLGTTLNEIALQSGVEVVIEESALPMRASVKGMCELLGFDPLYIANEGKLVAFVPHAEAAAVLEIMRTHEYGRDAAVIGKVSAKGPGRVFLQTAIGGRRPLDMLTGEQLPRIC